MTDEWTRQPAAPGHQPTTPPEPRAVVYVLNGANLGRLGRREPQVYGTSTYLDLVRVCKETADEVGIEADVRQTDEEGTLIGWLHEAAEGAAQAVVLNAGAWTHYSLALRDAAAMLEIPLVEVHVSNPAAREEFRHRSLIAPLARGTVTGFGVESYRHALRAVAGVLAAARRS